MSRKRRDDPDVILENTGPKRRAETAIEEINPRAGDGADVSILSVTGLGKTKDSIRVGLCVSMRPAGPPLLTSKTRRDGGHGRNCSTPKDRSVTDPSSESSEIAFPEMSSSGSIMGFGKWARPFIGLG